MKTFNGNIQINYYDAEGLHHEMEENGKLVSFIYHGDEVIAEESQEDRIRYIRTSVLLASDAESARTYYHYASDEMGSITHVVDENEEILNHYEYDAWGNLTVCEEKVHNRFKFNGQQYDPISQQYYLRARYYNPVIGRFTQEDSYNVDGLNLYVYCRNNPVSYVDPSGNICEKAANRIREKIANGDPVSNNERRKLAAYERNEQRKRNAEVFKLESNNRLKTDFYVGPDGIVAPSLSDYDKYKSKRGPKTGGTGPHNKKIAEIGSKITDGIVIAGGGILPEMEIPTPGGIKTKRRPDILVERSDGTRYGINVGKATAYGAPIKREVEAIYDLEDVGLPMYFVQYN